MMLSKSKNNTPLSPAEEGILKKLSPALKGSVVIIKNNPILPARMAVTQRKIKRNQIKKPNCKPTGFS